MGQLFPVVYDFFMRPLERAKFKGIRQQLISEAEGRVLEIGSGTGINFPFYKDVIRVDAIEPNPLMQSKSIGRKKNAQVPVETYQANAETLPFANDSFDTVVATLVFCTIPNPVQALQEIKRVSKPGAKILLFEHVKMDNSFLGKTQDILTPMWKKLCDGCHLNRDTLQLIKEANLATTEIKSYYKGLFLTIQCVNQE
ncbi:class I SAM-dependent methyltransferase [Aquibacillus salsiterrae]|uniref:Class I SAM-dependent methyltransferase n=1 Tax=Aquibacillus salsiterrae TaxID=2950439 RepID=A0A9X3WE15_9BACI|nr:class I SAM-dependent methyltransferase [Aquibacillus salsiterrae]MDC3418145.1 class I SAM-dependent methyltransferase [Aquibacillus salsiterrae]